MGARGNVDGTVWPFIHPLIRRRDTSHAIAYNF
jgi:hypothetical protein